MSHDNDIVQIEIVKIEIKLVASQVHIVLAAVIAEQSCENKVLYGSTIFDVIFCSIAYISLKVD